MKKYVFGVDIGGTTVKLGFFTTEGELLDKWEITTRKDEGGRYILTDIAASIEAKLEEKGIVKARQITENEQRYRIKELERELKKKEKELRDEREKVEILKKSLHIFMQPRE